MYGGEMSSGRRAGPTNTASAAGRGAMLAPKRLQLLLGARRGWENGKKAFGRRRKTPRCLSAHSWELLATPFRSLFGDGPTARRSKSRG